MTGLQLLLTLAAWKAVTAAPPVSAPLRKSVNPCGIVYEQIGSERGRQDKAMDALRARVWDLLDHINVTLPKQFIMHKTDKQSWIPDSSKIDTKLVFSRQMVEVNRQLKYFSAALDIVQHHREHFTKGCKFVLGDFNKLILHHRLLVCETDAAFRLLDVPPPQDYARFTVDVPSDWYPPGQECTQSGLLLLSIIERYKGFLNAILSNLNRV